jgi:hypothetical protein
LKGNAVTIRDTEIAGFQQLCSEFGFEELAAKLSEFQWSMRFKETENADARGRIAALDEKAEEHDRKIATCR